MLFSKNITEESPAVISDCRPRSSWPENGVIVYENFSVRYRDSLPLVLRNVTVQIGAKEKVGVVGRTGSGEEHIHIHIIFFLIKILLRCGHVGR